MIKKYAVAMLSFFDNDVLLEYVEVNGDWKDAFNKAFPDYGVYITAKDLKDAQWEAANQDWVFNVIELFNNENITLKR